MMKSLFKSRTFWIALAQSVVAIIVVLESHYEIGGALLIKSVIDVMLRVATTDKIK